MSKIDKLIITLLLFAVQSISHLKLKRDWQAQLMEFQRFVAGYQDQNTCHSSHLFNQRDRAWILRHPLLVLLQSLILVIGRFLLLLLRFLYSFFEGKRGFILVTVAICSSKILAYSQKWNPTRQADFGKFLGRVSSKQWLQWISYPIKLWYMFLFYSLADFYYRFCKYP
jgi:hypothetical protein